MSSGEQVELQLTDSSVPAAGISVRPTWQVPFSLTIRSQKQNTALYQIWCSASSRSRRQQTNSTAPHQHFYPTGRF